LAKLHDEERIRQQQMQLDSIVDEHREHVQAIKDQFDEQVSWCNYRFYYGKLGQETWYSGKRPSIMIPNLQTILIFIATNIRTANRRRNV
jgi:hypothetical protein